jgi:hypothetical protein
MHRVEPEYPADARREGTVLLCAIIAKDGTIERLEYVSGPVPLMRAAIDAVRQWRYKRTLLNGKPVEVETRIFVEFTLKRPASKKQMSQRLRSRRVSEIAVVMPHEFGLCPDKRGNRTSPGLVLHLSGKPTYQELREFVRYISTYLPSWV